MESLRKFINKLVEIFCISIMGIMTVLVSWQVFTRYVLNKPSAFTEKAAQYLFVWLVLYCSAYVFGKREHMSITFVHDKLPPKVRRVVDVFNEMIISLFTLGVMVYGGYISSVKQMAQLDAALQIPIGVIYSAIPASGLLVVFYTITNIMKILKTEENQEKYQTKTKTSKV